MRCLKTEKLDPAPFMATMLPRMAACCWRWLVDGARGTGYACVLLDTLDEMESARALYADLGFEETPPTTTTRLPGCITSRSISEGQKGTGWYSFGKVSGSYNLSA